MLSTFYFEIYILSYDIDYTANAVAWEILSPRVQIQSAIGQHESYRNARSFGASRRTNDDVKQLNIKNMPHLKYLPLGIGEIFKSLKYLAVTDNGLKAIMKDVFGNLNNTKRLWLQNNEVEELTDNSFYPLFNLNVLRLNHNQITHLEKKSFAGLHNLKKLWLNENLIADLPNDLFKGMDSLTFLDISFNKFKTLPETISHNLRHIEYLVANHNGISKIHVDFIKMTSLKQVELNANDCIDDYYGLGRFNFIFFGSKIYLRHLQNDVEKNCI